MKDLLTSEGLVYFFLIVVAIIFALILSTKVRAKVGTSGFSIFASKQKTKDTTKVKDIKNGSEVDIENVENRNIDIQEVDKSSVKIKK